MSDIPQSVIISNRLLIEKAIARGWLAERLHESNFVKITLPELGRSEVVLLTDSRFVSSLGRRISARKDLTHNFCISNDLPMPETALFSSSDLSSAIKLMEKVGKIVVKPSDLAHGKGVTVNIETTQQIERAAAIAAQFSRRKLIAQQQVEGNDVRLLFIGDTYVGSITRHPASVVGDGVSTIEELIVLENKNPQRGINYQTNLNQINLEAAKTYLGERVNDVPQIGERVQVVGGVNLGLGGSSESLGEKIHPSYIDLARSAKNACLLTHCGVDILATDYTKPMDASNPAFILELNGGPMLGLHERPSIGESQPAIDIYLDWLQQAMEKERA